MLLMPSVSWAAYTTATTQSQSQAANGVVSVTISFTGNAGEQSVARVLTISSGTLTAEEVRRWVGDQLDNLNGIRTIANHASLQPGTVIPRLARTPVTLTAKQQWREDLEQYLRIKDAGVPGTEDDLAAMRADLEARYQAGFLTP
jgi:hypothetical protein